MMIQIKASVDEALKKLDEVQKELKDVGEQSKKSSKTMEESMKSATRSAQLQVEAIKQVVSSLVNLGKSSIEVQKEIGRLNAAFESSGSSAAQASETYKNIFGFLGDSGAAVEAAQQLAAITPDTAKLKEYETILQGVYAKFSTSIETGGLAEGINHTIALGEVQGTLADAYEFLGISVESVNAKLATFNSESEREAYIRSSLTSLYGESAAIYGQNNAALIAYNQSQASLNIALAEAGSVVMPLLTSFNGLAATLLTSLKPALEVIVAAFILVIDAVSTAIGWIKAFFSIFSGGSKAADTTKSVAKNVTDTTKGFKSLGGGVSDLNKGLNGATKAAKELRKQTMGFDELNVVTDQTAASSSGGSGASAGGGGGGIGGVEIPDLSSLTNFEMPTLDTFKSDLDEAKEKVQAILVLAGSIALAFAGWKVLDIITNPAINLMNTFQKIGGYILIAAGAILAAQGYSDAWVNGIDWGNFALTIGGLAVAITGVGLAFGTTMAALVAAGAGIALVALAIKDVVTNGDNLRNTLTLVAGLLATLAGSWIAFSAPIALVVTGIVALVAGVASFINQGPTLKNTILIIGGAIAVAVGLATAGLSLVVAAIVAAGVALAAFTVAIVNEKKAIKDAETAQEDYTKAINDTITAHNNYKSALDSAKSAQEKLTEAEKKAGATGKELYDGVMNGKIAFSDMTAAQQEAYWAYLDNEKAQKDLKAATDEMKAAMEAEKKAFWENKLAVDAESGAYDEFKNSVVEAYENGALSAEEARDLIGASMSEMSRDTQKTFMEDLPNGIKNGLDPKQYETTAQKLSKWFSDTKTVCTDKWNDFKDKMGNKFKDAKDKAKEKFDGVKDNMKNAKNEAVAKFNTFADDIKSKFNDAKTKAKDKFAEITSKENLGKVKDDIVDLFGDIGSKAGTAIGGAVKSAINGALSIIETTINKGINLINGAIKLINKIPGVSVGKLSKVSLPRLAKGGVVDTATIAMIGEAGKEAVVPLENNTQWMDTLAERIAARSQTPTKVILKVGEKELGWATIGAINGITEQTGGLQLVL